MQKLINFLRGIALFSVIYLGASAIANATDVLVREPPFEGKISFSAKDSVPAWPQPIKAPKGAPNIVLVLLDDVGFGDTSTFGGPALTPALDRLAAEGLRYNRFHTTAICSSTRAALLSGRNHHRMGFGSVVEEGFPGYNGIWKKSTVSVAEVLRRNGYSTAAFGKWHLTPSWEGTPVGPFDRWPTGLGFEYFYGYQAPLGLVRNTHRVEIPPTALSTNRTAHLVDDAIDWIRSHESLAPDKPYFLYMAPQAAHWPHHVSGEWIGKYRGRFDQGWNKLREQIFAQQKKLEVIPPNTKLTPWPKELPTWDSLSTDEKRLYARQMEVYAAFLSQTDFELGRLMHFIRNASDGANTLVIYIVGDNGAEAALGPSGADDVRGALRRKKRSVREQLQNIDELGQPNHVNIYAAGWAWAGSTPFKWAKHVASHFGGTRNPMVLAWPARIKGRGDIRSQFSHVNDIAATLYEASGAEFPSVIDGIVQEPLDGVSLVYSFDQANAPSRHLVQYFEQQGNRAIYQNGWMASSRHGIPWLRVDSGEFFSSGRRASKSELQSNPWELYHVDEDFSQSRDLAKQYPEKLTELKTLFETEAHRNNVYPLDVGITGAGPPASYRPH